MSLFTELKRRYVFRVGADYAMKTNGPRRYLSFSPALRLDSLDNHLRFLALKVAFEASEDSPSDG